MTLVDKLTEALREVVTNGCYASDGSSDWCITPAVYDMATAALAEAERVKGENHCTLGVGDGRGQLFVHGAHESITAARAFIFRCEEQTRTIERLERELAELDEVNRTLNETNTLLSNSVPVAPKGEKDDHYITDRQREQLIDLAKHLGWVSQ